MTPLHCPATPSPHRESRSHLARRNRHLVRHHAGMVGGNESSTHRVRLEPGRRYVVGRGEAVDLFVEGGRVSREHCEVVAHQGSWELRDLESTNGTFVDGARISVLSGADMVTVTVGGPFGPGFTLSPSELVASPHSRPVWQVSTPERVDGAIASHDGSAAPPPATAELPTPGWGPDEDAEAIGLIPTGHHEVGIRLAIGRDARNDLVLDDMSVSRFHAQFEARGGVVELRDLGSSNGTFVNGHHVDLATLSVGDVVGIGHSSLVFDGQWLHEYEEPGGLGFSAHGLTVRVGPASNQVTLLHDVGFTLRPRGLMAVIGPSGAGKSTLLGALTGQRPADEGVVHYAGRDLYVEYDELRQRIGLVPQSDLLHAPLTVRTALTYGAKLRFPRDTTQDERAARVDAVMTELGLSERSDLRIDRLSGGQRKRTSVALELLTKPSLMFLDEPTSGLDPGLDLQVMQMLRNLADEGRTVVVVTHSVANLAMCDDVMILAPGGHLAYVGPPAEAPDYFGVADFAQIFLRLEQEPGEQWGRRFQDSRYALVAGSPATKPTKPEERVDLARLPPQPFHAQLATLARRYVAVIAADKAYLAFLAILPVMLAVLGILVGSDDGLGPGEAPTPGVPSNPQARFILLVLVLGAAFSGTASSVQELVKERTIYQRERAIGLSRGAYLLSKVLVLGTITAFQAVVFVGLSLWGRPQPQDALVLGNPTLEILLASIVLAVVSMSLGLLLSAAIPTSDVALPLLVLTTMVQVVLSGAVPIRFDALLDLLGWLTPAYWAFSMMASTTDLGVIAAVDSAPASWEHSAQTWLLDFGMLVSWFVFYTLLAYLVLWRREPRRARG